MTWLSDDDLSFAEEFRALATDQAAWSQQTFGSDKTRGPIGALKHLAKEAKEAAEKPDDIVEFGDCLILLLDATRRAGFTPLQVVRAAQAKMKENRLRSWPAPKGDEPVEHVRSAEEVCLPSPEAEQWATDQLQNRNRVLAEELARTTKQLHAAQAALAQSTR